MSQAEKSTLRTKIREKLKKQSLLSQKKRSREIQNLLLASEEFKASKVIFIFVSLPGEVDTKPLIDRALQMGKTVVVPLVRYSTRALEWYKIRDRKKDLRPGTIGILEPDPRKTKKWDPKKVDLVVVPGLAFDKRSNRLGQGAGFYDRFLARLKKKVPKIGLAFHFQVLDKVPTQKHDVRLDKVMTNLK